MPIFEVAGPFYSWTVPGKGGLDASEETSGLLNRIAAEQVARSGRPFVGVMGFSQGARLAAGLLLEQQVCLEMEPTGLS